MQIYREIGYIEGEDEYYGLEIGIVPYYHGVMILWRSASGRLNKPLLLMASEEGALIKVTVPVNEDDGGEWVLKLDGKKLTAVGPRDLRFELIRR